MLTARAWKDTIKNVKVAHTRLQLPLQPLRGLLPICCLVNRGTMGVNSLPKTVTRQCRSCDLNPGPSALEYSTLTTRLLSHPGKIGCEMLF